MTEAQLEKLKYPIGKCALPQEITTEHLQEWITILKDSPKQLQDLVAPLDDAQLDTPYRPEGWTVRQVIHHLADSHHHFYTRFKWALTEDNPTIKPYEEKDWAELMDGKHAPIHLSLDYYAALHAKVVYLAQHLQPADWKKTFFHPETGKQVVLDSNLGIYAWHCRHHYAHIEHLMIRKDWK